MKRDLILVGITVLATALIIWALRPKPEPPPPVVPQIVTKFDTVETTPKWLADSIKQWKKPTRIHTTDTVNVVITNTIVDTAFVPVNAPAPERPNLWPIVGYTSGGKFGDTAFIRTFSVRTGQLGLSRVFTAGVLTHIEADSTSMPKLTFIPFPPPRGTSLWTKLKYIAIGAGTASAYCTLVP